jgi:hypothetical protein
VVPHDPGTPAQVNRREAFGRARFLWGQITDKQRAAWNEAAHELRTRPRLNQSGRLSGYLLFVRITCNLAAIGLPPVFDPPPPPQFGRNPVHQLSITALDGTVSIKLSVVGAVNHAVIVQGTRPRSRGTTFVDHFVILGLLPMPEEGMSDITDLWVARYGYPQPGSRILIRTVQQVSGYQDLPKQVSAVVPTP